MATGLHLSTIAFSVRNCLAAFGPSRSILITATLRQRWDPAVDQDEVEKALGTLCERRMIDVAPDGLCTARDPKVYQFRQESGAVELEENDPRAWEGWH